MHIVGYLYEDYRDARSLEHKVGLRLYRTIKTLYIVRFIQIFEREKKASRFVCGKLSTYKYIDIFIYKVPSVYRVKLCMNRIITMCQITLIFFVSEKREVINTITTVNKCNISLIFSASFCLSFPHTKRYTKDRKKTQIYKSAMYQDYISRQYYKLQIYSRKRSIQNYLARILLSEI